MYWLSVPRRRSSRRGSGGGGRRAWRGLGRGTPVVRLSKPTGSRGGGRGGSGWVRGRGGTGWVAGGADGRAGAGDGPAGVPGGRAGGAEATEVPAASIGAAGGAAGREAWRLRARRVRRGTVAADAGSADGPAGVTGGRASVAGAVPSLALGAVCAVMSTPSSVSKRGLFFPMAMSSSRWV